MKTYPKYKPSNIEWIGEIPIEWNLSKIKFTSYVKGRVGWHGLRSDEFTDVGALLITGTDFINGKIDWETSHHFSEDRYNEDPYIQLKENDLLITKDGTIGKVALVKNLPYKASLNSGIMLIRPLTNHYITDFMFWMLNSKVFFEYIEHNKTGSTIQHLYQETFEDFSFTAPQINEQKIIVYFLNDRTQKIDTLIEKKQKLIDLLKEERTATINQAVTKGLNPDVPMKESGVEWLGEIPKHWEVKRLKYVSYINPIKSNIKSEKNSEEFVTFLPMEKVSEDGKIDTEIKKPIKDLMTGFTYFEENDVIVAKITPCFENGKGALIKNLGSKIGFGSTEFHVLRPREKIINKELLYYLTKSDFFMKLGESLMTGAAGQKRVPTSFLDNFVTCYSKELEEQNQIIKFIKNEMTKNDYIIAKIDKEIALLQEYRTSLISEVVTGKIDVREAI